MNKLLHEFKDSVVTLNFFSPIICPRMILSTAGRNLKTKFQWLNYRQLNQRDYSLIGRNASSSYTFQSVYVPCKGRSILLAKTVHISVNKCFVFDYTLFSNANDGVSYAIFFIFLFALGVLFLSKACIQQFLY